MIEDFIGIIIGLTIILTGFILTIKLKKVKQKKYSEWATSKGYLFKSKIEDEDLPIFYEAFIFQRYKLTKKRIHSMIKGKYKQYQFVIGVGKMIPETSPKNHVKEKTVFIIKTPKEELPEMIIKPKEIFVIKGFQIIRKLFHKNKETTLKETKTEDVEFDKKYVLKAKNEQKAIVFLTTERMNFLKSISEDLVIEIHNKSMIFYHSYKDWIKPNDFESIMNECVKITKNIIS